MNFIVGDLHDVDELVLEIAKLTGAAIMAEDIADCESEIDPSQEANITNVLHCALAHHRQNSQLVSIIEYRGEISAVCREDEVRVSGHQRECVGVHSIGNCLQVGASREIAGLRARDRLLGLRCSIKDDVTKNDEPA